MAHARRWVALGVPVAVLVVLMAMSAPLARGQEADAPHPAHIHAGTCANLGDIVAPLSDVTEQTAGETFGAESAILVKQSATDVALPLGEILSAPHAINVHESAQAIQNYIACGDLGGRVIDGALTIGLRELNGSGHHGVAVLAGNAGTHVTLYLTEDGTAAAAAPAAAVAPAPATATAAETPADAAQGAEAPAAAEVPVDIRDFAYSPDPLEIAVGDTVTWTNQDAVPHTATGQDRDVLQSGTIPPGASFSQGFSEAGEFGYFCEFHPNMTGTIIVQ
jgi:plastocyanin